MLVSNNCYIMNAFIVSILQKNREVMIFSNLQLRKIIEEIGSVLRPTYGLLYLSSNNSKL